MKHIYCLLLLLCPYISRAQHALSIGTKLPAHTFQKLRQVTGKYPSLYILDFWATWCSSCIKNFPNLVALQSSSNGGLQVILVNSKKTQDTPEKINNFFKKYNSSHSPSVPFPQLITDTLFTTLFPFTALPHYVWIDSVGFVKAITGSEELTLVNVNNIMAGISGPMPDRSKLQKLPGASSLFWPLVDIHKLGAAYAVGFDTVQNNYLRNSDFYKDAFIKKYTCIKQPLLLIYQKALGINSNRIHTTLPPQHPLLSAACNFELITPASITDSAFNALLVQKLSSLTSLSAGMQTVNTKCYAIRVADTACFMRYIKSPPASPHASLPVSWYTYQNQTLSSIAAGMGSPILKKAGLPIIINETGYYASVSLSLPILTKNQYRGIAPGISLLWAFPCAGYSSAANVCYSCAVVHN